MIEQVIYSRYEFPDRKTSSQDIFKEYGGQFQVNDENVAVAGFDVCIRGTRNDKDRAVIILTYDKISDTYLQLKLAGIKELKIRRLV